MIKLLKAIFAIAFLSVCMNATAQRSYISGPGNYVYSDSLGNVFVYATNGMYFVTNAAFPLTATNGSTVLSGALASISPTGAFTVAGLSYSTLAATNGYLTKKGNILSWKTNFWETNTTVYTLWTNGFFTNNCGQLAGTIQISGACPTNQTQSAAAATNQLFYYGAWSAYGTNGQVSFTNLTMLASNGTAATVGFATTNGAQSLGFVITPANTQSNVWTVTVDLTANPAPAVWPISSP